MTKTLTLKENQATYSVSLDKTQSITKPVILKREGHRIAALVPIAEYEQFVTWRKEQQRPRRKLPSTSRKREHKGTWQAEQERILKQELTAFERMKPELLKSHNGKWVAIHKGELVDFDDDEIALAKRVYAKFGYRTILMTEVTETPRVYHVNSPKLVR